MAIERTIIDPDTWRNYSVAEPVEAPMFDRGFTGHEHITTFGLINMNGRCYDPLTSSFLSVDAYVQDPTSAQAFNRYAYCNYNPLRYTDPTGWSSGPRGGPVVPNQNTGGHTQWHSNDPNDMLWGRSLHPSESANPTTLYTSSSGFTIGNGYVVGNYPPSQLRAIRAWQNNPCKETSQALEDLGITVNVGCVLGEINGVGGFRASTYSWTDATGQSYITQKLDYVGGDVNEYYTMTNKTPESYDSYDIAGRIINTAGLYTTVESTLHYSPSLGIFKDKQGTTRHFYGNPNKNLRKKMKYGKTMSKKFGRVSSGLNVLGIGVSIAELSTATNIDEKIQYGSDIVVGIIGFAPGGPIISTFWFFGGRELVFRYGDSMVEMMNNGINPGLPEYQPFK